jgi:aminocarboxymuconate-semialdehyde decarboxylase
MFKRSEIIDFSSHILPDKVVREVKGLNVRFNAHASRHVEVTFTHDHYRDTHLDKRIEILKRYGITAQVLSFGPVYLWELDYQDPQEFQKILQRLTSVANDSIAEVVERYRDLFIGMCTLPTLEGWALEELRRCYRDLGFKAVQIYSNVYGRPIDSQEFIHFYREVSALGLPVFIHPISHQYYPWIYEYSLFQIFGWPFDTTLAMARLVFSGLMLEYPNIPFVTHHVGGMVPYYWGRIAGTYGSKELHGHRFRRLQEDPIQIFKRFYADTASFGVKETIELGIKFFSPDRVVFGTDYPFGPEQGLKYLRDTIEAVKSMGLHEETLEKILYSNAAKLLKI